VNKVKGPKAAAVSRAKAVTTKVQPRGVNPTLAERAALIPAVTIAPRRSFKPNARHVTVTLGRGSRGSGQTSLILSMTIRPGSFATDARAASSIPRE
jgi:hypothetical protein